MARAVLVQLCVDPRLNHELLRSQVRQKLGRLRLSAERIFLLGEVGGNIGANFQNTLDLLKQRNDKLVLCAVLHHDECLTAAAGTRVPLEASAKQLTAVLAQQDLGCRVLTGNIRTEHNQVLWSDEPEPRYKPWSFGAF